MTESVLGMGKPGGSTETSGWRREERIEMFARGETSRQVCRTENKIGKDIYNFSCLGVNRV